MKGVLYMQKTMVLCGAGNRMRVLQLDVDEKGEGLEQSIREAALDYCRRMEGRKLFIKNGGLMYCDFFNNVSDDVLSLHGIMNVEAYEADFVISEKKQVLSVSDAALLAADFGIQQDNKASSCEVAIRLAIMWGITQTLESRDVLEKGGMDYAAGILMQWADEFIREDNAELSTFFKHKLEKLET